MTQDLLGYNEMVERAMRSVVRQALTHAAENGLPGNHHFYVTFNTDHPDVGMPDHLRQQYPNEMTIVLQHQFWGLEIDDEGFDVTLSFNKQPERLRIPFESLVTFADPSVNFGLQFHVDPGEDESARETKPVASDPEIDVEDIVKLDEQSDEQNATEEKSPDGGDNIVTLDTFRKKLRLAPAPTRFASIAAAV